MAERPGEMDERDVDERFASIIARWDGPVPDGEERAPTGRPPEVDRAPAPPTDVEGTATEDVLPEAPRTTDAPVDTDADADAGPSATRPAWVNPSPLDIVLPASSWRAAAEPDDETKAAAAKAEAALEDEHFEPPPVSLPPQEDLHFWGAVIGLVAGPLMLLYVVFARPFHSTRWFVASVAVSLIGFALLVLRQPRNRDDHDSDDGARV
ncbi:hypothetical protein [Oryzobacter terrae]|uniref:hypothetical protein n=1 Tax=Oryzobacter terrae TaxID=1620385 RepID=UPI00366E825A